MENHTKGLSVKIHKTQDGLIQMILAYSYGSLTADLGRASAGTYEEIYARLGNIALVNPDVNVTVGKLQCTIQFAQTLARRSFVAWGMRARPSDIGMDKYLTLESHGLKEESLTLNEYGKGYARGYTEGEAAGYEKGRAQSADDIADLSEKLTNLEYEVNKLEARNRNTKREFGERVDKTIRLLADIKASTLAI